MPKTSYRDHLGGYHGETEQVYHTRKECPVGAEIPDGWLRPGGAGRPLCPTCRNLEEQAKRERAGKHIG